MLFAFMRNFEKFDSGLFNSIRNLAERAIVLGELGTPVHIRCINGVYQVKIYALFDFYVEVWICMENKEVDRIFALESDRDWEGYLRCVNLADYF
jgi:hypothetical protein